MQTKKAEDLTPAQREIFEETFYALWNEQELGPVDTIVDSPWGLPWYHESAHVLTGQSVEEMAENFFNKVKADIRQAHLEDIKNEE